MPLASLLADMASALAFQYGTDAASVLIGPVDFGDLHES